MRYLDSLADILTMVLVVKHDGTTISKFGVNMRFSHVITQFHY